MTTDHLTNGLKAALAAGRLNSGFRLGLANADASEVVAGAGFDWLQIEGEQAPNHLRSTIDQLQAAP
jgi:4-hydroxy-2-oxoheptanedioate aldolase